MRENWITDVLYREWITHNKEHIPQISMKLIRYGFYHII